MAPIISRLLPGSWSLPQQHGLQAPLQALISNTTSSNITKQLTSAATHRATASDNASYRGGPQIAGIDLVAMLVSDSGLARTEPVWWNTSPIGCLLIGLQPRGGWQVLQRTVQWGQGRITRAFGVNCTQPALYAYFTCSIRNRLEVWESPRWESPMRDCGEGGGWAKTQQSTVSRPTKLIDGSRVGQALMCDLLRPKDDEHYGIEQQARMQFLSVLLVACGLMRDQSVDNIKRAFVDDFAITERLSVVFRRLVVGVAAVKILLLLALTAICYHFWHRPLLQGATPYVVEIGSIVSWAVGAVGLLMEGGNPRVKLIERAMAPHVEERYNDLLRRSIAVDDINYMPKDQLMAENKEKETVVTTQTVDSRSSSLSTDRVTVDFGSLHGSVLVKDKGHCYLPPEVLRLVLTADIVLKRPWKWYISAALSGIFLVVSIALQLVGTRVFTTGSVVVGVIVLLCTSVLRGTGISGPEEWQIPRWKRRNGVKYGAALQGALVSR